MLRHRCSLPPTRHAHPTRCQHIRRPYTTTHPHHTTHHTPHQSPNHHDSHERGTRRHDTIHLGPNRRGRWTKPQQPGMTMRPRPERRVTRCRRQVNQRNKHTDGIRRRWCQSIVNLGRSPPSITIQVSAVGMPVLVGSARSRVHGTDLHTNGARIAIEGGSHPGAPSLVHTLQFVG